MTLLENANKAKITESMRQVAADEDLSPELVCERVANGTIVIPKNRKRQFRVKGIGKGLSTKVNANIGTSPSHFDINEELNKLDVAVASGADAVMDLSTGGNIILILEKILAKSPVMVGTVPIYKSVSKIFSEGKQTSDLTADDMFSDIEAHAKAGVDFITVHCGITMSSLDILEKSERLMGIVSRGGSLLSEWIAKNQKENPLFLRLHMSMMLHFLSEMA